MSDALIPVTDAMFPVTADFTELTQSDNFSVLPHFLLTIDRQEKVCAKIKCGQQCTDLVSVTLALFVVSHFEFCESVIHTMTGLDVDTNATKRNWIDSKLVNKVKVQKSKSITH